jgi:peptidylprolyl isomerase
VAQSRRREREIARRRFERRRLAEMQRRQERRHRNNVIGAVVGVVAVLGAIIGIGLAIAGGGSPAKAKAATSPSTSPSASPSTSPSSAVVAAATKTCKPIKPNPPAAGEPKVPSYKGKVPAHLVTKDLKTGHGATAKSGDAVTVKYVGVGCSSGKVFDASYTDGAKHKEFTFTLGQGSVIPGWDQGVPGMKVGGVRELVIPGKLAYGATGSQPSIGPNAPLIFLVTLDKVSGK